MATINYFDWDEFWRDAENKVGFKRVFEKHKKGWYHTSVPPVRESQIDTQKQMPEDLILNRTKYEEDKARIGSVKTEILRKAGIYMF